LNRQEIKETLYKKINTWKNMSRENNSDWEKANDYYDNEIMELIIEEFLAKDENKFEEDYDYLIVTVGQSYQPIVLSILALQPKNVLFLVTRTTKKELDKIFNFIDLKFSQCYTKMVDKASPIDVYQKIKELYDDLVEPIKLAVDFTGGTKSMSTGAAMAGSLIGADVFYITSKYLRQFRAAEPGTERLAKIENPYEVFGDLDEKKAFGLWNEHNYQAAAKKFNELLNKVRDDRKYKVLNLWADAYANWEKFNLIKAIKKLEEGLYEAKRYSIYTEKIPRLSKQLSILKILQEVTDKRGLEKLDNIEHVKSLIFSIYSSAVRKEDNNRYDIASLLLYRILEMIAQRRLASHDIDVSAPALSKSKKMELLDKMNEIIAPVKPLNKMEIFPEKISCIKGYILLSALDDPISEVIDWGWMMSTINTRNQSILAHGFEFISKENYHRFKELVLKLLNKFCKIEEIQMKEMIERFKFIKLRF